MAILLRPGQAKAEAANWRTNEEIFDHWSSTVERRLAAQTLANYRAQASVFLRHAEGFLPEFTQIDFFEWTKLYEDLCRHRQRRHQFNDEALERCAKGYPLRGCGVACPGFARRPDYLIRHHMRALVSLYDHIVDHGLLEANPAEAALRRFTNSHKAEWVQRRWTPSIDDVRALIAADAAPWRRFIYVLLAKTGIRINEAINLRFSSGDFDQGWLEIPIKRKGGESCNRIIILDSEVKAEWRSYARWRTRYSSDHVLLNGRGRPFTKSSVDSLRRQMRQAADAAGINPSPDKRFALHHFRHFFTTEITANDINPTWKAILRGDKLKGTDSTYVHVTLDQIRDFYRRYAPRLLL